MKLAPSVDAFLEAPIGRYIAGRTWLFFCANKNFSGFTLWGSPNADDARLFLQVMPFRGSPLARVRQRLVDVRRLDTPDGVAFNAIVEHFRQHAQLLKRAVDRVAVVHSTGMNHALAAGFPFAASIDFPVAFFDTAHAAVRWLGEDESMVDVLDQLQAHALGMPMFLRDLRAVLRAHLRSPRLSIVAAKLHLSPRTMQRRLHDHGTSFYRELSAVRVAMAQELLVDTSRSITQVAYAVGCGSPQHFTTLFRSTTGLTPVEWRRRGVTA